MERNWDDNWGKGDWGLSILSSVELGAIIASERRPRISFTFVVQAAHCNRVGILHGGCVATLFDLLTSMVLLTVNDKPGFWQLLGLSRSLNCNYLRPAHAGDRCRVECEIIHVGRKLCLLRGTLYGLQDDQILATCEHHKFNTDRLSNKL
ncbi:Acyl-coenzyme A thioesterase 13 [Colletotrichum tropicale]|nr:Acyl-coenzyme A thioesterase 13 [Colletotrichum tropicale]